MKEIWKDIPGYGGYYQASTNGKIRGKDRIVYNKKKYKKPYALLRRGKILRQSLNATYLSVELNKNARAKNLKVHRLVAQTFIPNPKNKPQINHKNSIRTDNRVENLEWCTHAENMKHAMDNKRMPAGEENRATKLNEFQVRVIRKSPDMTSGDFIKIWNVCTSTISNIRLKYTWKYV